MAAIAVVLAVAALVITRITEAQLIERVDRQLESRAVTFEQRGGVLAMSVDPPLGAGPGTDITPEPGGGGSLEPGPVPGGDVRPAPDLRTEDGSGESDAPEGADQVEDRLIAFSLGRVTAAGVEPLVQPEGDLAAPTPDIDPLEAMAAADGEPFTTGSQGSDARWRVKAVVAQDTDTLLVIAQPLTDVDATVERLVTVEAAATLAVLAALGVVAWWVDRHGIRPVKRMTATATAIAAGDLSHRVPDGDLGTEAGRLGLALNQMLARIELAFDERSHVEARLRQFVADASHELRTPLTAIRGYSELYESGGLEDGHELSEAMRRTRQEAVRMGSLVDDLLLLARLDQGPVLARTRVDLAALVRDAGRDARAVDPARDVVTTADGPLHVLGDGDRLRQALANLVGNALVHTPTSAPLRLRAGRDGDRAVVEVADRGPGMSPEDAARAFERFFRADPSRSRHRGGSGLGLAIVEASVAAHGGEVRLDSAPGRGTTARVTLPLAPDGDAGEDVQEGHSSLSTGSDLHHGGWGPW
jgi:two-component system OmpR family sensor kinase